MNKYSEVFFVVGINISVSSDIQEWSENTCETTLERPASQLSFY